MAMTVQERYRAAHDSHTRQHAQGEGHWCTTNRCGKCGRPLQWAYDGPLDQIVVPPGTYLEAAQVADIFEKDAVIEPCMNTSCGYRLIMGRHLRTTPHYYLPGGDGWGRIRNQAPYLDAGRDAE
tara:strand:+ start:504 stop:875 length:372 start_codon:yes stop_codon:yes gene_type:complete